VSTPFGVVVNMIYKAKVIFDRERAFYICPICKKRRRCYCNKEEWDNDIAPYGGELPKKCKKCKEWVVVNDK